METYESSIRRCIGNNDIPAALKLLETFRDKPVPVQEAVLNELALATDSVALELLDFLTDTTGLEQNFKDRLFQLVIDRSHLNFAFAGILFQKGDAARIREAVPLIRHILTNETRSGLLRQAIETCGRHRLERLVDDVAEYLYFDDHALKRQAALALQEIATSQSLYRLKQAAATIKCDQSILDAIAVHEPGVVQECSEAPKSVLPESTPSRLGAMDPQTRFKAFVEITTIDRPDEKALSEALVSDHRDLVLNCLRVISRTLPEALIADVFNVMDRHRKDAGILFSACETLGAFPVLESAASLILLADHPAFHVRLSAIRVLDRNLTDFITAELKSRIESGSDQAARQVETILEAQANRIITTLMSSDTFSYIASNYLAKRSSPASLGNYIQMLQNRGLKSTVKKFEEMMTGKRRDNAGTGIIVSSLPAVLRVYEKTVYDCGLTPLAFGSAQEAFEHLVDDRPALVICDLFLNTMTGFDFAREIRGFYTKEELPVLMSTLQNDFSGSALENDCRQAGVNAIELFPAVPGRIARLL